MQSTAQKSVMKNTPPDMHKHAESARSDHAGLPSAIVGIGCSAGGLEALEAFVAGITPGLGVSLVIVQHLAPDFASILPELLASHTRLAVHEARHGTPILPDCIYVIPPNKTLSFDRGCLYLSTPPAGLRLPVDHLFHTLAHGLGKRSIGVILSGMGEDGMLGVQEMKACGGRTYAQDPLTARADSMPRSAIERGVIDFIASPERLARLVLEQCTQQEDERQSAALAEPAQQEAMREIIALLQQHTGNDFSHYKPNTLNRRIERRMALLRLDSMQAYAEHFRSNLQERDWLLKELLIGVTRFFRDTAMWDYLRDIAMPALFAQYPAGKALRAWVPACSSGEEAYSLAILFRESLLLHQPAGQFSLKIYATDLDGDAIQHARRGVYSCSIAPEVGEARLKQYFVYEEDQFRVSKDIRDMVVFATQNIISDPPFTRLDILSCRNLMIYLDSVLQEKLLPLFHYALCSGGILVLGSAETIGRFSTLFVPLDKKNRIFSRGNEASSSRALEIALRTETRLLPQIEETMPDYRKSLEYQTDQLIQQNYAPAGVLINNDGDILYISGRVGKYLEPAAGKVNVNIHAMAREGLASALHSAIQQVLSGEERVQLHDLQVDVFGTPQRFHLTVQHIRQPAELQGRLLVVFTEAPPPKARSRRRIPASERELMLEDELEQTRKLLRSMQEDMQIALEEMNSGNEELQATNEELTTSREELQSLNEELQTINVELQAKLDDLTWERNDMNNLLNSTEIATVFLDGDMRLRRFTRHATTLFKLIPGDIGRPLSDIRSELEYPQLLNDATKVLQTLVFEEKRVHSHNGRWYRVRIMPYRRLDNVIDGIVITFIDTTEIASLEARLQQHME